jgi:hypothetical protein
MFRYFRRINRRIDDTLNIYQDIGKLSFPFFKIVLILISFLIVTSSVALIFSFFVENEVSMDANSIWINYSLPIIIYGVICPLISTLISLVFKMFLEVNISNIVNKYKYIKKKEGKPLNIFKEIFKVLKFISCSKFVLLMISSGTILLLPFNNIINIILMVTFIVFCVLRKLIEYYDNSVDCYITDIEKCYTDEDFYWRYKINVKYPHEERRIVTKRFNDFKKLHNDLDLVDSLPTANWIKPFQIDEAEERGKKLNIYMKRILTNKDIMSDSIFYSFFRERLEISQEINPLVIERKPLEFREEESLDQNCDSMLKNQLKTVINEEISRVYILYDINYYIALKKRFFVICNNDLYKLKYDKFFNKFTIRHKVKLSNIFRIEKSKIINTSYLTDRQIIILNYIIDGERKQLILTSLSNEKNHSVDDLYKYFEDVLKKYSCRFVESEDYIIDNGLGISERIQHNGLTINIKKIITTNILQSKNYFRNFW